MNNSCCITHAERSNSRKYLFKLKLRLFLCAHSIDFTRSRNAQSAIDFHYENTHAPTAFGCLSELLKMKIHGTAVHTAVHGMILHADTAYPVDALFTDPSRSV